LDGLLERRYIPHMPNHTPQNTMEGFTKEAVRLVDIDLTSVPVLGQSGARQVVVSIMQMAGPGGMDIGRISVKHKDLVAPGGTLYEVVDGNPRLAILVASLGELGVTPDLLLACDVFQSTSDLVVEDAEEDKKGGDLRLGDSVWVKAQDKHINNKKAATRWSQRAVILKVSTHNALFFKLRWVSAGLDGEKPGTVAKKLYPFGRLKLVDEK
jgi:hypothetical protein